MLNKYLLVPIPKNPYFRVGPSTWQDYYQQLARTAEIAGQLTERGSEVIIAIISGFQAAGKPSEIEIYSQTLHDLRPELKVR